MTTRKPTDGEKAWLDFYSCNGFTRHHLVDDFFNSEFTLRDCLDWAGTGRFLVIEPQRHV